jgi:hypothetical protein
VFYATAIDFAGVRFASCNLLPYGKLSENLFYKTAHLFITFIYLVTLALVIIKMLSRILVIRLVLDFREVYRDSWFQKVEEII